MEEKIFEKFDFELACKREIEIKISNHLEEKFYIIKSDLQKESKIRYDSIENLEYYFEKELPKIQEAFKVEQTERDEADTNILVKLNDENQKYLFFFKNSNINFKSRIENVIFTEKKNREETQEGILEMIKIMNERMKNDLSLERREREQNEEILIELLENTCNRLQQSTTKI